MKHSALLQVLGEDRLISKHNDSFQLNEGKTQIFQQRVINELNIRPMSSPMLEDQEFRDPVYSRNGLGTNNTTDMKNDTSKDRTIGLDSKSPWTSNLLSERTRQKVVSAPSSPMRKARGLVLKSPNHKTSFN
jgi:hypothetical protein